eukprot:3056156-Rhodomonas_salina.1
MSARASCAICSAHARGRARAKRGVGTRCPRSCVIEVRIGGVDGEASAAGPSRIRKRGNVDGPKLAMMRWPTVSNEKHDLPETKLFCIVPEGTLH